MAVSGRVAGCLLARHLQLDSKAIAQASQVCSGASGSLFDSSADLQVGTGQDVVLRLAHSAV